MLQDKLYPHYRLRCNSGQMGSFSGLSSFKDKSSQESIEQALFVPPCSMSQGDNLGMN